MAGIWEKPGFARFWTADNVSGFGTQITAVALPTLAIVTVHATDTQVGLLSGARWTPYLLFGLLAGVIADRYRRRPLLVATDLARVGLLALIAALALAGGLTIVGLTVFVVVFGTLTLLYEAAHQSYLPRLVTGPDLTTANARIAQSASVAQASGPFLGGALVAAIGAPVALLVDAVSYLVSGLLLLTIRRAEPVPPRQQRSLRAELREGTAWVYRHRQLAPYAVTLHVRFVFGSINSVAFVLLVVRELGGSGPDAAFGYGVVLAVGGIGSVIGASLSSVAGRRGAGRVILIERLTEPVGWALAAVAVTGAAGWVMVGAAQFVVWFVIGLGSPNEMAWRQSVTPDRLQGRMNATIRSLNWGMFTIGAPLGGLLSERLGYRPTIAIAAAGMALAAIVAALSPLRSARIADAPLPPAQRSGDTELVPDP